MLKDLLPFNDESFMEKIKSKNNIVKNLEEAICV